MGEMMKAGLSRRMLMASALLLACACFVLFHSWPLLGAVDPAPARLAVLAHAAEVHIEEFPVSADIPKPLPVRLGGVHSAADPLSGVNARYRWPGFTAQARFDGNAVELRLEDHQNRLRLRIDDGRSLDMILFKPGDTHLRINGLSNGPHSIALDMLSEASSDSRFGGFFLFDGGQALAPPPPPSRRILFIGDSDTVGYASTSQSRECSAEQVFLATDTSQSFPALLAQSLDAEETLIARSGIGLLRNYGGADPGRAMADIYQMALPERPDVPLGPIQPPDVIVIGLGSNDFATPLQAGEAFANKEMLAIAFSAKLLELLKEIHLKTPLAALLLLIFPKEDPAITLAYIAASKDLRALGASVEVVALPPMDRQACHWHPSPADHHRIATALRPVVLALRPDWKGSGAMMHPHPP